jgi:hypothetical protein
MGFAGMICRLIVPPAVGDTVTTCEVTLAVPGTVKDGRSHAASASNATDNDTAKQRLRMREIASI